MEALSTKMKCLSSINNQSVMNMISIDLDTWWKSSYFVIMKLMNLSSSLCVLLQTSGARVA